MDEQGKQAAGVEWEPCLICGAYECAPGQVLCGVCDRAVTPKGAAMEITTYGQARKGQQILDHAEVFGPDVDVWVMATPKDLGGGLVRLVVSQTGTPDSPVMAVEYEAHATTGVVAESAVIAANTWAEAR